MSAWRAAIGAAWLALACASGPGDPSSGRAPVRSGPYAFLVAPFTGDFLPASAFNHGGRVDQLLFDGRHVYGKPGHWAYDFAMPEGTPILAAGDGLVTLAGDVGPTRCWGTTRVEHSRLVRILHEHAPDGLDYGTVYMHLSEVLVAPGQRVRAGDRIGLSGNTGCSHGPHLHFQVNRVTDRDAARRGMSGGYAVDPYGWWGPGADPRIEEGKGGSKWLWREGQAPSLRRTGRRPQGDGPVRIASLVGTDLLDPGGESVTIAVDASAPGPVSLRGYQLENGAGDAFALPSVSVAPGAALAVRTSPTRPLRAAVGLIDDHGDCVHLVAPDGEVVGWAAFGPPEATGRCRRAPPSVADPDPTE